MISKLEEFYKLVRIHSVMDSKRSDWGASPRGSEEKKMPDLIYIRTSRHHDLRVHGTLKNKLVRLGLIELHKEYRTDEYDIYATKKCLEEAWSADSSEPELPPEFKDTDGYGWTREFFALWNKAGVVRWLWENLDRYELRMEDLAGLSIKVQLDNAKKEGAAWLEASRYGSEGLSNLMDMGEINEILERFGKKDYHAKSLIRTTHKDLILGVSGIIKKSESLLSNYREKLVEAEFQFALAQAVCDANKKAFEGKKPSEILFDLPFSNLDSNESGIQRLVRKALGDR